LPLKQIEGRPSLSRLSRRAVEPAVERAVLAFETWIRKSQCELRMVGKIEGCGPSHEKPAGSSSYDNESIVCAILISRSVRPPLSWETKASRTLL
jgi:hypothetical protein